MTHQVQTDKAVLREREFNHSEAPTNGRVTGRKLGTPSRHACPARIAQSTFSVVVNDDRLTALGATCLTDSTG